MEIIGAFFIGLGSGIGLTILVGTWIDRTRPDEDAIVAPHPADLTLKGTRCVQGKVRHLFLGNPLCTRDGCLARNPDFPPTLISTPDGLRAFADDGHSIFTEAPAADRSLLVRP